MEMTREWQWSVAHDLGTLGWLVIGICLLVGLAEAWACLRAPALGRRRPVHFVILGLRLATIACLAIIVAELGLEVETRKPSPRKVLVFVDESASMAMADFAAGVDARPTLEAEGASIPDTSRPGVPPSPGSAMPPVSSAASGKQARWERANEFWRGSQATIAAWRERGVDLEVRSFGGQPEKRRPRADAQGLPADPTAAQLVHSAPTGRDSDLSAALDAARKNRSDAGARIAAIVVVSDGALARDPASAAHIRAVTQSLEVPLHTVGVGGHSIRDVSLTHLRVGEFAFVENVATFEVDLVAHGYEGHSGRVELMRDGQPIAESTITIVGEGNTQTVRFEVAPDRTGQFVYQFRFSPLAGEATLRNNQRNFVVKVLRDKVRVLHVAGRPDWDVRSLRTLLKRDPNVELLSYYILRDKQDFVHDDGRAELSLVSFPRDELFRKELGSFDLLVMHNFDIGSHDEYIPDIAQYVLDGGSLVVIGGDQGLARGEWHHSTTDPLLPVNTSRPVPVDRRPFRPRLTEVGGRHPVTAWLRSASPEALAALPRLDTFNPLPRIPGIEGAATLLAHPSSGPSGVESGLPVTSTAIEGLPLVAVAEPGKGRVITISSASTWRWGFAADLPLIDGARPYDRLWLGVIRWLLHDEHAGRLRLEPSEASYSSGSPVDVRAQTLDSDYGPEPGIAVSWRVTAIAGTAHEELTGTRSHVAEPATELNGQWTTGEDGRARQRFQTLPDGAYEIVARRESGDEGAKGLKARRVFLVGEDMEELARLDPSPGHELLDELAQLSAGRYFDASTGARLPVDVPMAEIPEHASTRIERRQKHTLWDTWQLLVLLMVFSGAEWVLRRRAGEL